MVIAVIAGTAACGSSRSSTTSPSPASSATASSATACVTPTATGSPSTTWTQTPAQPAGTLGTKPTVVVPSSAPPSNLVINDLIVGNGATAAAGDKVTVQYVGDSWTTKHEFDASWNRGQPFTLTLGAGEVIPGWDQGILGMKVGGRRELIIPPGLGYGCNAPPGSGIAPNDTLVFIVDLTQVTPSSSTTTG
jgi:peptidylprolyl isomerase